MPDAMARKHPWLLVFQKERSNCRSYAGQAWKQFLELLITVLREGWCDLEILLDPHFLHLPKRVESVTWYPGMASHQANLADPNLNRREPADLLEALVECNRQDPWRNHYRDTPQYHPSRNIARLPTKFFNIRAVGDQ
ncbi:hypothetical protein PHYSODRAFT_341164 [Phytophthora sojae]|nr:hypothetical protein PHYSODRAFT_341164 [Phytophthora sojae]EGZ07005.1 hypothetical protein PHYSODRAFT_341164 [Phytophthora sojae]|eukprot:XP_009537769.1 hypothetical protein PHYSODRAFT_341164 [Phytophthora sojae]